METTYGNNAKPVLYNTVQCIYKQRIVLIPTQLSTCKNDVQLKNRLAVCVVTLLAIQTQERGVVILVYYTLSTHI